MGAIVRLSAVLRGSDVVSPCMLEAWQERSSSGRVFTRCQIVDDPPDLPDGPYALEFAKHSIRTRKFGGAWELVFLPSEVGMDLLAFAPGIAS